MNDIKITIITPTYNRAGTLERLYNSLVEQTFKEFKWLVMDDGSTDETPQIIEKLKAKNQIEIEYHRHENVHKVITLHRGFQKLTTPYVMRIDSDDYIPYNSLEIFYKNMLTIENDDTIASVVGRVGYSNGKKVGNEFPTSPFIEFVFLMKYKFKVKGVHMGLFKTKMIKESSFKEEEYLGKGYLPDFWNFEIDSKYKTMFINDIIYTYDLNENDNNAITQTKFNPKYAFGLSEQYRFFIKYYLPLYLFSYPIPIAKNMFKYIYYSSFRKDVNLFDSFKNLDNFLSKCLFFVILPFAIFYKYTNNGMKKL